MIRFSLTLAMAFGLLFSNAKGQVMEGWTYGGPGNESAFSFCLMPGGGFVVVGLTRSFGAGTDDFYVVRLSSTGHVLWSRTFGMVHFEQAFWVEATADGGVLVTGFSYYHPNGRGRQDFWLIKLDASGNQEWQNFSGSGLLDVGFCGKPLPSGYAALGISREGDTFGNFYLLRLDGTGARVWYRIYDAPPMDYGHEFQLTADGGFMLFGSQSGFHFPTELDHLAPHADLLLIRTDSAGVELWRKNIGGRRHDLGRSIKPAPNGGYYLFGSTQNQGMGSFDMWLLRINDQGDTLWTRTFGGTGWDYGMSMDVGPDGSLYLAGTTSTLGGTGSPDIYVVKTDPNGNALWSQTLGADSSDYGTFVRALPTGGCAVAGYVRSIGAGGRDMYLTLLDSTGQLINASDPNLLDVPGIVVSPNPVVDESRALVGQSLSRLPFEWRIYDMAGRLVSSEWIQPGETPLIRRSELATGPYIYEILQKGKMIVKGKFVVQ